MTFMLRVVCADGVHDAGVAGRCNAATGADHGEQPAALHACAWYRVVAPAGRAA